LSGLGRLDAGEKKHARRNSSISAVKATERVSWVRRWHPRGRRHSHTTGFRQELDDGHAGKALALSKVSWKIILVNDRIDLMQLRDTFKNCGRRIHPGGSGGTCWNSSTPRAIVVIDKFEAVARE